MKEKKHKYQQQLQLKNYSNLEIKVMIDQIINKIHKTLNMMILKSQSDQQRVRQQPITTIKQLSDKLNYISIGIKRKRPEQDEQDVTTSLKESQERQHQIMVEKMTENFQKRLKISEHASKMIEKNIEKRKQNELDQTAPKPAGSFLIDSDRSSIISASQLMEKLRKKERDEFNRSLLQHEKQRQQNYANAKKDIIESLLPAKRRQYIEQLANQVRQSQNRARAKYEAKLEEKERRRLEELRLKKIEQERKERERLAEIERQRLADIARREAEARAEAKAKADAEAAEKRRIEQEQRDQQAAEERKQKDEERKAADEIAQQNRVPDMSSSLLPDNLLQSRDKTYLKPCAELAAQMKKNVDAWTAFENEMKVLTPAQTQLDKEFFQIYPDGSRDKITKTDEAITRIANTITKYNIQDAGQVTQDQQYQTYSDQLIYRFFELNEKFAHNPNVIKFAIYKLVYGFASNKFASQAKQKLAENRQNGLEKFLVDVFDRLHFQLPQMYLKEMILGFFAQRNMLFYPINAQLGYHANGSEAKLIELRGFRLEGGKKEAIEKTIGRLQIHAVIFFSLQLSDAYIGRVFLSLSTLMCLKHTQLQAGVIFYLLEVTSARLLQNYKRAFVRQLKILKQEFIPSFRAHIQNPNGLKAEPQNQAKYLADPEEPGETADYGQRETTLELEKLDRLLDQQLASAAQIGFQ